MIALSAVFAMNSCEEDDFNPEPINPKRYDITQMTINFNEYDEPVTIQFRATKPHSDCSDDVSFFDYRMSFNPEQSHNESFAYVKADFGDIAAYNSYGDFLVDGIMSVEVNSRYSAENLGVEECARPVDYFELYMDDALVITNFDYDRDGEWALNQFDLSGENRVSSVAVKQTGGDLYPSW